MANLEEKILNGPTVHYCDAGDDDIRHDEMEPSNDDNDEPIESGLRQMSINDQRLDDCDNQMPTNSAGMHKWTGVSRNTGPKGVLADQRKLNNSRKNIKNLDPIDKEIDELMEDDEYLQQYVKNKFIEMQRNNNVQVSEFGTIQHIRTGEEFLKVVDKEHPNVLIVVHVYVRFSRPCEAMNKSLEILANQYKKIKFVTLDASVAGMSENFKDNGVPALLAYKNGDLVKSLVRLTEELDKDFEFDQVKEFLELNGII